MLRRGCNCVTGCATGRCGIEGIALKDASVSTVTTSVVTGRDESGAEVLDIVVEEEVTTAEDMGETDELMGWVFGP